MSYAEGQKLICFDSNESVYLTKYKTKGGEGEIWEIKCDTNPTLNRYIAKLYKEPTQEKFEKLEAMIKNPPDNPTKEDNHISIAWPEYLLKDCESNFVGFLMPHIRECVTLTQIYDPESRLKNNPNFHWALLNYTARNIASIVYEIHRIGHVLCDMAENNILVNPSTGYVSIIDTDSFQIYDQSSGKKYKSSILGTPGYMPPEILDSTHPEIEENNFRDRFQLAVIIHLLLFEVSPFWGEPPFDDDDDGALNENENIRRGLWLHSKNRNTRLKHSERTIPLDIVHKKIQECFYRCFDEGHKKPYMRPSATEWFLALQEGICELIPRSCNHNHYYIAYKKCYWCERSKSLGYDVFQLVTQTTFGSISFLQIYP
jgi:DNA-binding helix-hairpin-helix protein with protein kinase domain